MPQTPVHEQTRITATGTWTEVAGATKGLSGFTNAADRAELDVLVVNWATTDALLLVAVTSNDTAPSADTEAIVGETKSQYGRLPLQVTLSATQHLWVKSDQDDTRVLVSGFKEEGA